MTLTSYLYSGKHSARLNAFSKATGRKWNMSRIEAIAAQVPSLTSAALVLDKHNSKVRGGRATGNALVAIVRNGVCKTILLADRLSKNKLRVDHIIELSYA